MGTLKQKVDRLRRFGPHWQALCYAASWFESCLCCKHLLEHCFAAVVRFPALVVRPRLNCLTIASFASKVTDQVAPRFVISGLSECWATRGNPKATSRQSTFRGAFTFTSWFPCAVVSSVQRAARSLRACARLQPVWTKSQKPFCGPDPGVALAACWPLVSVSLHPPRWRACPRRIRQDGARRGQDPPSDWVASIIKAKG